MQFSFAAGRRARAALHAGSFVWADDQNSDFESLDHRIFHVRAANGLYFLH
jgi:hypothetical protein